MPRKFYEIGHRGLYYKTVHIGTIFFFFIKPPISIRRSTKLSIPFSKASLK